MKMWGRGEATEPTSMLIGDSNGQRSVMIAIACEFPSIFGKQLGLFKLLLRTYQSELCESLI